MMPDEYPIFNNPNKKADVKWRTIYQLVKTQGWGYSLNKRLQRYILREIFNAPDKEPIEVKPLRKYGIGTTILQYKESYFQSQTFKSNTDLMNRFELWDGTLVDGDVFLFQTNSNPIEWVLGTFLDIPMRRRIGEYINASQQEHHNKLFVWWDFVKRPPPEMRESGEVWNVSQSLKRMTVPMDTPITASDITNLWGIDWERMFLDTSNSLFKLKKRQPTYEDRTLNFSGFGFLD
jgi:hypothetical protein